MKLKEIYKLALELGIKADPRSKKKIDQLIKQEKERYQDLKEQEQKSFDKHLLESPYADSRIQYDNNKPVKKILVGIDIDVAELLLAKELGADTVICHHPLGASLARLDRNMKMQADVLEDYGIPINIGEDLIEKRMEEISRNIAPANHYQVTDAAKLLDINLVNIHTPCDNLAYNKIRELIDKKNPQTIKALLELLETIPEYREASKLQMGPRIFVGNPERRTGKIALTEITGGTSGSKEIYEKMSQYGIGTVVGMHMEEEHRKNAEKNHINVVIAGHMASDSLGVNIFLNELRKKAKNVEIIPTGGLIEIRTK